MHHTTVESPHDVKSVSSLWSGLIDMSKYISGWVEQPHQVQEAGKTARDIPFGIRRAFQDYKKAYPAKFTEYPQEYRLMARLCKSIQEIRDKPAPPTNKQLSRNGLERSMDRDEDQVSRRAEEVKLILRGAFVTTFLTRVFQAMVVDDEGGPGGSQPPAASGGDHTLRFKKKQTPTKLPLPRNLSLGRVHQSAEKLRANTTRSNSAPSSKKSKPSHPVADGAPHAELSTGMLQEAFELASSTALPSDREGIDRQIAMLNRDLGDYAYKVLYFTLPHLFRPEWPDSGGIRWNPVEFEQISLKKQEIPVDSGGMVDRNPPESTGMDQNRLKSHFYK
ncbi:hypothetical protein GALMADRAFT_149133 [Galerina marginata CBS 339.88]|uniref:Uncharacterized protein n=1 Tax=Galerina marginata (strain CBS 339.88) TaxID=685588 RepID=A0A067S2G7_GALM3|nr:hypothetical protein GALMADRAFT_149133 [Galerina marginata CBS 339.88]